MTLRPVLAAVAAAALAVPAVAGIAMAQSSGSPIQVGPNANAVNCDQVRAAGVDVQGDVLLYVGSASSGSNAIVSGTVTSGGTTLAVELLDDDYVISAVVVKGGNAYNVYTQPPFSGMISPPVGQGNTPQISHWFVCGYQDDDHTPTPTPSPTKTRTPKPPTHKPTETPAPSHTPSTPVPVPTSVPAGTAGDAGPGSAAVIAGVALAGAAVAGAAVAARRRQENGA